MSNSFQNEIPRARINITLDVDTGDAQKNKELPLKLLVFGDFSYGNNTIPLAQRERTSINKNNFDSVLASLSPKLALRVPNTIKNSREDLNVKLSFKQYEDFHPRRLVENIPELTRLLAMRNLLKELKSILSENKPLRQLLENHLKDKKSLLDLKQQLNSVFPLQ